jgi:ABC-type polar amino acid transport system ATPase subunit
MSAELDEPLISVQHVCKRFGESAVLNGVSLDVRPGEVAVIVGPSGGGKSTLLRTINGLESFDRGRITVDQLVLGPTGDPHRVAVLREIRRRVGMVFQQFNLFPHRNVLENVIEAPIVVLGLSRDEALARARPLLERVGLAHKEAATPASLSGGQQQRVAIARALAMQPEVILLDEPTSALDPRMTAEVVDVITDLARSGQTMIVVTHAMTFARRAAHTVYVMDGGQIAESGSPQQIFDAPAQQVTRDFLANSDV